jgi:hypothetical protein
MTSADQKYFSYRFESVGTSRPAARDNLPCRMHLVQKYIAVDRSVTVENVVFWGAYFRTLLYLGELDSVVEHINMLPFDKDNAPASIVSAKCILTVDLLAKCPDAYLVWIFTTVHGWGEEDFIAGGQITELDIDDVDHVPMKRSSQ